MFKSCATIASPVLLLLSLLVAVPVVAPTGLAAQEDPVDSYYRGMASYFGLPTVEVRVLSEWEIRPEEVPLVLFMARQAGVSTDALLALKEGGRGWSDLTRRYGLDAGTFHVPLPSDAPAGSLAAAYEQFRSTPSSEWDTIALGDAELVELVNIRVLSEHFDVPPVRVLQARERTGSYVEAYRRLVGAAG